MRRMKERLTQFVRDERGANAVLIAFLIVPMLGFGALALDISAQHAERTQLQNGSDAAAMAIAASCAQDEGACTSSALNLANDFVAGNGGIPVSGTATIESLDLDENEVTVRAGAEFPHFLASLIDGDEDPNSTTVAAAATAEWGVPLGAGSLALAFPYCQLVDHLPNPDTGVGEEIWIRNDNAAKKSCSDVNLPGNFGWLDSANCTTVTTLVGTPPEVWVEADPGKSPSGSGCTQAIFDAHRDAGEPVLIPVYDEIGDQPGNDGQFRLMGFAAWVITGWDFPGVKDPDNPGLKCPEPSCSGIRGYFTNWVSVEDALGELGNGPPLPGLPVLWRLAG